MDVNSAWKDACRVILGTEVGELLDFAGYLSLGAEPMKKARSSLSGKEVSMPSFNFPSSEKFISEDETPEFTEKAKGMRPLSLNEIKDFDSLVSAVSERAYYCGNIVLGNSGEVSRSNRCMNVWHAQECSDVYDSKFLAYCSDLRFVEYAFGCSIGSESTFSIHALEVFRDKRLFETIRTYTSSDCYYCASCEGCQECMFCFCQKNKRHSIGNLPLQKEKYFALKKKLLADITDELKRKRYATTITEIINGA